MITCCPNCGKTKIKKNGHIHNGKQNNRCKECGRQFVKNPEQKLISEKDKEAASGANSTSGYLPCHGS
jgi:transposase-like protein